MKTFKWSIPEPSHHQDSWGDFDPTIKKEKIKEFIFGVIFMSVGYLLLLPLSEFELIFDEAIYTALFVLLVTSSGFLSALTCGKNGMKGNLAVSVVGVFWFASTYSSTDALWAVGLLFLGFYHIPILLGWSAGYGFYKNRKRKKMETEPVEIANT